jgi:hypothetical protein
MKIPRPVLAVFLGIAIVTTMTALIPSPVQAQTCGIPGTPACPPREKRTKRPTPVPPSRTPTPTATLTPTATQVGIPLTGGMGGPAEPGINPSPAVTLHNFASPVMLSGLGFLLLVLVLTVLFRGGVFDPKRGLFKRFGVFGHSNSAYDGTGISEVDGNDQSIGLGDQKIYLARNDGRVQMDAGSTAHELGHNLDADHDGLSDTWEEKGEIDMNTDGSQAADQGNSSSTRKPPDSD